MYKKQIDDIERGLESYANELRGIATKICNEISSFGKNTVDVDYYTDGEVQSYYFAVDGYDNYPESAFIVRADDLDTAKPTFHMVAECTGNDLGEWTVDDFNTEDILGVCRILDGILGVVRRDNVVRD